MSEVVAVGVDIAKAKFDVAILLGEKIRSKVFPNTRRGYDAFLTWARQATPQPLHVCLEATGTYGEPLADYLSEAKVLVSVVNPLQIAKFAQALGTRNKTDRQDARTIARFCHTQKPRPWVPVPPEQRVLRELVRRLDAVFALQRQESNRLSLANDEGVRHSIQAVLGVLEEQVRALKGAIATHLKQHPGLHAQADLLDSIPGVGEATIAHVLAELPRDVLKCVRRADAFVGLSPQQHQSGSSVHRRSTLSKKGNARLRKALYFPAIVACHHNPVVMSFYQRMLSNGLTKKQAVCAAMRKLLHLIIGVLKSQKPFDPDLHRLQTT